MDPSDPDSTDDDAPANRAENTVDVDVDSSQEDADDGNLESDGDGEIARQSLKRIRKGELTRFKERISKPVSDCVQLCTQGGVDLGCAGNVALGGVGVGRKVLESPRRRPSQGRCEMWLLFMYAVLHQNMNYLQLLLLQPCQNHPPFNHH